VTYLKSKTGLKLQLHSLRVKLSVCCAKDITILSCIKYGKGRHICSYEVVGSILCGDIGCSKFSTCVLTGSPWFVIPGCQIAWMLCHINPQLHLLKEVVCFKKTLKVQLQNWEKSHLFWLSLKVGTKANVTFFFCWNQAENSTADRGKLKSLPFVIKRLHIWFCGNFDGMWRVSSRWGSVKLGMKQSIPVDWPTHSEETEGTAEWNPDFDSKMPRCQ
jgi:hypothetical protein